MDTTMAALARFRELQSNFNQAQRQVAELQRQAEQLHHDARQLRANSQHLWAKVQRALAHRPTRPAGRVRDAVNDVALNHVRGAPRRG